VSSYFGSRLVPDVSDLGGINGVSLQSCHLLLWRGEILDFFFLTSANVMASFRLLHSS
jgi:hypothetical protein